jgi:hypothetical protein
MMRANDSDFGDVNILSLLLAASTNWVAGRGVEDAAPAGGVGAPAAPSFRKFI